jgi:hypothetical protein
VSGLRWLLVSQSLVQARFCAGSGPLPMNVKQVNRKQAKQHRCCWVWPAACISPEQVEMLQTKEARQGGST